MNLLQILDQLLLSDKDQVLSMTETAHNPITISKMSVHSQVKAVASLIYRLGKPHSLIWVHDGEELVKLSKMKVSKAKIEALDVINSVDESQNNVKNKETGMNTTLFIVLGNGNDELVCDWTTGDDVIDTIISQHSEYWENK